MAERESVVREALEVLAIADASAAVLFLGVRW
jgi:hypothetical protein